MTVDDFSKLVVFALDNQRYALRLSSVERIMRAVEITPLPKAPEIVLGVLNLHGQIVPAIDMRKRLRLPEREIDPGDRLIIAHTSKQRVALVADAVIGVTQIPEGKIVTAGKILPGIDYVEGVAKLEDGTILIHSLEEFLSLGEAQALNVALGNSWEIVRSMSYAGKQP